MTTATATAAPVVVLCPSPNYPRLSRPVCTTCWWGTAGYVTLSAAGEAADQHADTCTGTTPTNLTPATVVMNRDEANRALGIVPAAPGHELAAAYFANADVDRVDVSTTTRTAATWFAPLTARDDRGTAEVIGVETRYVQSAREYVTTLWRVRDTVAAGARSTLRSYGFGETRKPSHVLARTQRETATGRPAPYREAHLRAEHDRIVQDLSSLVRPVPGSFVDPDQPMYGDR